MILRLTLRSLYVALSVIASLALMAGLVLTTETGTRLFLDRVVAQLDLLSWTSVTGSLTTQIQVENLRIDTPAVAITIANATIDPNLLALFAGTIFLDQIELNDASVHVLEPEQTQEPEQPDTSPFSMPFPLVIQTVRIEQGSYQQGNGEPILIDKLRSRLNLSGDKLDLSRLSGVVMEAGFQGEVGVTLNEPYQYEVSAQLLALPLPDSVTAFSASAELKGDTAAFSFNTAGNIELTDGMLLKFRALGKGNATGVELDEGTLTTDNLTLLLKSRYQFESGASTTELSGEVYTRPVTGSLVLHNASPDALLGTGKIQLGDNLLLLNAPGSGQLEATLNARNLTAIYPDIAGAMNAELKTRLPDWENFTLRANAMQLSAANNRIQSANLKLEGREGGQMAGSLNVSGIAVAGEKNSDQLLGNVSLGYNGKASGGQVDLAWQHPDFKLDLATNAEWQSGIVEGKLSSILLRTDTEQIRLLAPAAYRVDTTTSEPAFQISRACVSRAQSGKDNQLCIETDGNPKQADFTIASPDLISLAGLGEVYRSQVALDLNGKLVFDLQQIQFDGQLQLPEALLLRGEVDLNPDLHLTLTATGDKFNLRQALDLDAITSGFKLSVSGNPDQMDFNTGFELQFEGQPAIEIGVQGKGNARQVTIGSGRFRGDQFDVQMDALIDLASEQITAKLGGKLSATELDGKVDLTGFDPAITHGSINVNASDNQFNVVADGTGRFNLNLVGSNLGLLDPQLGGLLLAEGYIIAPDFKNFALTINGDQWHYGEHQFRGTRASALGKTNGSITATLDSGNWTQGLSDMGTAQIKLTMAPDAQTPASTHGQLSLNWLHPDVSVVTETGFDYQANLLRGQVQTGTVTVRGREWMLPDPVAFEVQPAANTGEANFEHSALPYRFTLSKHCWVSLDASFCAEMAARSALATFEATLANLALEAADMEMAPEANISAQLGFHLTGSLNQQGPVARQTIDAVLKAPTVRVKVFEDQAIVFNSEAVFTIRDQVLHGHMTLDDGNTSRVSAALDMQNIAESDKLSTNFELKTDQPGLVTAFVPYLDQAKGSIAASGNLKTLTGKPEATLNVVISEDASVIVPSAGITLTSLGLNAKTEGDNLLVEIHAESGGGKLDITTSVAQVLSDTRFVSARIQSDKFKLINRPDLALTTSSDITATYASDGKASLAGQLRIKEGLVHDLVPPTPARSRSTDVTVINREQEKPVLGDLDLQLEVLVDTFRVEMFGFTSDVEGAVNLTQTNKTPRRAVGNVNLKKGTFSRFGQNFDIDRGRLIFAGPIDNPLVDVVSTRTINSSQDPITVTLTLAGPANNMTSSISSSPVMSEANALSYLIIGRSLETANSTEGASLANAALALGLKQGLPLAEQIRSTLGLTELTVGSGNMDSTSVIAGKRISSKLYVEYNYDVFAQLGGILFSYQLTPKVSVETRSGEASSMRLIYTFE